MGDIIYGPPPTEKKGRFIPIIWMVLGACLALGAERTVEFIPKGEPTAQQDPINVGLVTWPTTKEVDIVWKSEKETYQIDAITPTQQ